jgi:uncharacterized protein YcbK (DUF882 family)
MDRPDHTLGRRALLRAGLGLGASALLASVLGPTRARAAALEPRRLRMVSTHTGEKVDLVFFDGQALIPEALGELDWFLRDPFTSEVHRIDTAVLDLAWAVTHAAGRQAATYEIVCGYRSPATNARLHAASPKGVASNSLHLTGKAIDLRLRGLPTARLRDEALRLGRGGVGFYADQDFVHLDSGRPRSW